MKIVIYGECDQYGSGAWCYFETLKEMGHTVTFYSQFERLGMYQSILFRIQRKIMGGVLPWLRKRHADGFYAFIEKEKPEIVIVLKGLLLDKPVIQRIKDTGAWTILINHDDFFSKFSSSRSKFQFRAIPVYDYIFPTKEINVPELMQLNPRIEFFQFAYYPAIHHEPVYNAQDAADWSTDLVFIGTAYPERKRQLEFLVTNLPAPFSLKIYGNHWNKGSKNSVLKPYIQGRSLRPEEMSKAIFYAKIALGFLCKENRDDYTQRTFEIPANGGLLLAERTPRHLNYYAEDREAVFFDANNYTEMLSKVMLLLKDHSLNERIRKNGTAKLKSSAHTYKDGLTRIFLLYAQCRAKNDFTA